MAAPSTVASDRRRKTRYFFLLGLVFVAVAAIVGFKAGDNERINQMWVTATVHHDQSAALSETIDYVFPNKRHGIFRDVPGLQRNAEVQVSANAPDQFVLESYGYDSTRIKIGDPDKMISGTRRYNIDYPLPRIMENDQLQWNGVGPSWQVPLEHVHLEVVGPWKWTDATCNRNSLGPNVDCTITQPEPGRLVLEADDLHAHEGILIQARRADPLGAVPAPGKFTEPPANNRLGSIWQGLGIVLVAAILALAVVARLLRRAGRDLVGGDGSATGTAFSGAPVEGPSVLALDDRELAAMTTIDFAPPPGLEPWQGGLVLDERVVASQKVAWLLGAAASGDVELVESNGKPTSVTYTKAGDSPTDTLLQVGFSGRTSIPLGTYDKSFSAMWSMLGSTFEGWAKASELWDGDADARRRRIQFLGVFAFAGGIIAVFAGLFLAARYAAPLVGVAAVGGLAAGAGFCTFARGWELRRRTPVGTGLRLRIESFRRFLAESESSHVEDAARRGVLRQYTAWAVAVGEVDHWAKACAAATNLPSNSGVGYAVMAPALMSSTTSTSSVPSSSGGGGGGGGGGFGGGGGGSW